MARLLPLWLGLVAMGFLLSAMPTPALAGEATVQRVIFGSAGFSESNRFWNVARPEHLQFDPFLETLLDVDPKTGEFVPRLAEKWQASPDMKEWTFFLRKGVQFHNGFGEFTAKDVVHSHSFMLIPDATATFVPLWRQVEEVKVIDDYQVVFRMKRPVAIMPYLTSRAADLRMVSKAQWDKEGLEGFDKRPAGTGSYRYVDRKLGLSISYERVDKHWAGEKPDFKELEIRMAPEATTRLAMLLGGEAHIVDLPRELQKEATGRGMKLLSSSHPVDWISIYFGGQYYLPGDPKFKADVPWTNKKVRQAMNMAVNRKELLETIFAGKATPVYVSGWLPISEGWNPEWATRFDSALRLQPGEGQGALEGSRLSRRDGQGEGRGLHQPGRVGGSAGGRGPGGVFPRGGHRRHARDPRPGEGARHGSKQEHALLHSSQYHWLEAIGRTDPLPYQSGCGEQLSGRVHRNALSGPDAERRLWRAAAHRPGDRRSSLRRIRRHPAVLALQ